MRLMMMMMMRLMKMMKEAPALENIPKGVCSSSNELRMYCSVRQYLSNSNETIVIKYPPVLANEMIGRFSSTESTQFI